MRLEIAMAAEAQTGAKARPAQQPKFGDIR